MVKAKEELAEMKREVIEKAMEAYKASMDFKMKKAQVMAIFRTLKEFYDDHHQFSKEVFYEGFKLDQNNCLT